MHVEDKRGELVMKITGEVILQIRMKYHLTQQALADRIGGSKTTIYRWEKGRKKSAGLTDATSF